ncbi:hypothetical protein L1987_40415 [Smallanthus sonchifolius]|uniref:Uncharacterized protein n=1 Tax=Smallanthus sonchifolius TaxID=185202 RepID=A0ACB9GT35_9ASTR|nr:hypothetical protein L1987_40415 [Smallanthus sonchifolius]
MVSLGTRNNLPFAFDLGKKNPSNDDSLAPEIQRRLRIIVAGGDETPGWILGVISDLNLPQPLPLAMVSLGTRNNLPFAFGLGKKTLQW